MRVKILLKLPETKTYWSATGTWIPVPLNLFPTPEEDDLYVAVQQDDGRLGVIPKSNIASIDIYPDSEGIGND